MKKKTKMLLAVLTAAVFFYLPGCGISTEERESGSLTDSLPQGEAFQVLIPLEGEDATRAKELVTGCVVRLDVEGEESEGEESEGEESEGEELSGQQVEYYGSGVFWDSTEEGLVVATVRHLLEKGELLRVVLADGTECSGRVLGVASSADVGFVLVEGLPEASPQDLSGRGQQPVVVSLHQRIFDTLDGNSALFAMAGTENGAGDLILDGALLERAWYREEFGTDVMILSCDAGAGMSGGGVFDGYGNLVGLVAGGSDGKTAVITMETVNEAYGEVCGRSRDTGKYE